MFKFFAPIVSLSGIRENLDYQNWIQERIFLLVEKARAAEHNRNIGVGKKPRCFRFHSEVGVKNEASGPFKLISQFGREVRADKSVRGGATSHGKHLTIKKLALNFGLPLDPQVLSLTDTNTILSPGHETEDKAVAWKRQGEARERGLSTPG